jgi:hypothetical protein
MMIMLLFDLYNEKDDVDDDDVGIYDDDCDGDDKDNNGGDVDGVDDDVDYYCANDSGA